MVGIIYCAESPHGKKYIGRTIQEFRKRKYAHFSKMRQGSVSYFHNALRKYETQMIWTILEEINIENKEELNYLLNEKEIFYINKENTLYPNGYNLQKGGVNTLLD